MRAVPAKELAMQRTGDEDSGEEGELKDWTPLAGRLAILRRETRP